MTLLIFFDYSMLLISIILLIIGSLRNLSLSFYLLIGIFAMISIRNVIKTYFEDNTK